MTPAAAHGTATPDPALAARIVRRTALHYEAGAASHLDQPAHVRAGSGMARVGGHIVIVQDDANFLAVIDSTTGATHAVPLPPGDDGRRQFEDRRGNKHLKLDLEACFVAPDERGEPLLVALGSGSTSRREQVVVAPAAALHADSVAVRDAGALYAALRADPDFAPGEMNIEGAVYVDGRIRLFGRGNGAVAEGQSPTNATCELDWPTLRAYLADPAHVRPPAPTAVMQYALGELDGLALGFTDAALAEEGGAVLFTAAAEDSPDVTRDGRVSGSAVGVLDAGGRARWTVLVDAAGAVLEVKVEGVLTVPGDVGRLQAVIDQDDPDAPSELCEIELTGPWLAAP
jgi:hypothetical protein